MQCNFFPVLIFVTVASGGMECMSVCGSPVVIIDKAAGDFFFCLLYASLLQEKGTLNAGATLQEAVQCEKSLGVFSGCMKTWRLGRCSGGA